MVKLTATAFCADSDSDGRDWGCGAREGKRLAQADSHRDKSWECMHDYQRLMKVLKSRNCARFFWLFLFFSFLRAHAIRVKVTYHIMFVML
jgi:hypothetical protein